DHCTKFVHLETTPTQSGSLLSKDNRATTIQQREYGYQNQDWDSQRRGQKYNAQVKYPFDYTVCRTRRVALIRQMVDPKIGVIGPIRCWMPCRLSAWHRNHVGETAPQITQQIKGKRSSSGASL